MNEYIRDEILKSMNKKISQFIFLIKSIIKDEKLELKKIEKDLKKLLKSYYFILNNNYESELLTEILDDIEKITKNIRKYCLSITKPALFLTIEKLNKLSIEKRNTIEKTFFIPSCKNKKSFIEKKESNVFSNDEKKILSQIFFKEEHKLFSNIRFNTVY